MKRPITNIYFRGYYDVARASDILSSNGIRNEIVRSPIQKAQSCSFTIAVSPEDEEVVIRLLTCR